jgi:hypothetical protein
MPLTQELVERLTPIDPAPGEDFVDEFDGRKKKGLGKGRNRRLAWTRYLRSEGFFEKSIAPYLPTDGRYWHVGVGLVPTLGFEIKSPDYMKKAIEESGYCWGTILLTDAHREADVEPTRLDFRDFSFPVIKAPVEIEMHSLTLGASHNLAVASRSAWARANATSISAASLEGLLTARHIGPRAGTSSFWCQDSSCTFKVHRTGSSYIDAAYLDGSWGSNSPSSVTPKCVQDIAAGDAIELEGAFTSNSGHITHTPHPTYIGGGAAAHIFATNTGISGDSGGRMGDLDLISMYLGKATLTDGTEEGLSLAYEQIVDDLEIELFD